MDQASLHSQVNRTLASYFAEHHPADPLKTLRLRSTRVEMQTLIIEIASDHLGLEHKLGLEQSLTDSLNAISFQVLFRRQKASPEGEPGLSPQPQQCAVMSQRPLKALGLTRSPRQIPGVRRVYAIASGKGGVGKSTLSANLAVGLSNLGLRVGLLDADIYGPSAPIMMGIRNPNLSLNDQQKLVAPKAHGVQVMSMGILSPQEGPAIWRGPMVSKALIQMIYQTAWDDLDVLILDLPPGTGDIQLSLLESVPVDGAIVVTTPQDVALLDADKALAMFAKFTLPIIGLVENMSTYRCSHCGTTESIFGEGGAENLARSYQTRVLQRLPLSMGLRVQADLGEPPTLDLESPLGQLFVPIVSALKTAIASETGSFRNPELEEMSNFSKY